MPLPMTLTPEFDPDETGSYGYYRCPTCSLEWYGPGSSPHDMQRMPCDNRVKRQYIYVLGPRAVRDILERGEDYGLNPFFASEIRASLPDVVAAIEKGDDHGQA